MTVGGGATFTLPTGIVVPTVISNVTMEDGGLLAMDSPTVEAGGVLSLTAGTATTGANVSSGGVLDGPGELRGDAPSFDYGLVSGVALGDAGGGHGELGVEAGGVASGVLEAGEADYLVVASGGLADDTRVTGARALLVIDSGGRASGSVLLGADAAIFGVASGTQVSGGGTETVFAGGQARATVLSGGAEYDYGRASGTKVRSGGHEFVEAHATAVGAMISRGGQETVSSAGVGVGAQLFSGGTPPMEFGRRALRRSVHPRRRSDHLGDDGGEARR